MFEEYFTEENEKQGFIEALHNAIESIINGDSLIEQYDWDCSGKVGFTAGVINNKHILIEICSREKK